MRAGHRAASIGWSGAQPIRGTRSLPSLVLSPDASPSRFVPTGAGLLTAGFATGQVVGPVLGGLLTDWTTTLTTAFLLAAAVSVAVAALASQLERWAARRSSLDAAAAAMVR